MESLILDVREPQEYDAEHVAGAVNVPLSSFDRLGPALVRAVRQPVVLMCLSGGRATLAQQALQQAGVHGEVTVFPGGITQWKQQGKPVIGGSADGSVAGRQPIPIIRQVQIITGSMVVVSLALAWGVHPLFAILAALVGAGLALAGLTGFCGLALLLAKAPWNRAPSRPSAPVKTAGCSAGCGCSASK